MDKKVEATAAEIIEAMNQPAPCPFCGNTDRERLKFDVWLDDDPPSHALRCGECGAAGPSVRSPRYAHLAWNQRKSS